MCQDLEETAKQNFMKKLVSFPPGLHALYERMVQQIGASDNDELCKEVLTSISFVYRPIMLAELMALTELLEDIANEVDILLSTPRKVEHDVSVPESSFGRAYATP